MGFRPFVLAFGVAAFAAVLQPAHADPKSDEAAVKQAVTTEMDGAATHDIDKTMSVYAPGTALLLFDAAPGSYNGYDAVKAAYIKYFTGFPGKAEASIADLRVRVSGDLAYATSIQTWKMVRPDTQVFTTTQRVTNIYNRIGGKWLCVHEHASVPVDYFSSSTTSKAQ